MVFVGSLYLTPCRIIDLEIFQSIDTPKQLPIIMTNKCPKLPALPHLQSIVIVSGHW